MFASIIYHLVKCFRRKTFEPILVKIRGNIPFFISNEWSCNIKHILFTKRLKICNRSCAIWERTFKGLTPFFLLAGPLNEILMVEYL